MTWLSDFNCAPEIDRIALNRRYEEYAYYRLWLEAEPVICSTFSTANLASRVESLSNLDRRLSTSNRELTCVTTDPNEIRAEMTLDHQKQQASNRLVGYAKTFPTKGNLYKIASVCFDTTTPTSFMFVSGSGCITQLLTTKWMQFKNFTRAGLGISPLQSSAGP